MKTLSFWQHPGFTFKKSQWVSGAFAQNFVSSARFDLLCRTAFGQSIPSSLRNLRLCDLRLGAGQTITFGCVLNLFGKLEELDFAQFDYLHDYGTNPYPFRYTFCFMTEHSLRLAEQIPFCHNLIYKEAAYFQELIPQMPNTSVLKRLIDFSSIIVLDLGYLGRDIEHFLNILKNLDNIRDLRVSNSENQQDLLDQLPDYCSLLRKLEIRRAPSDFRFLLRLKHLIQLNVKNSIDTNSLRTIYQELKFLWKFHFRYFNIKAVSIEVGHHPKRFRVWTPNESTQASDIDSAIRFILEKAKRDAKGF